MSRPDDVSEQPRRRIELRRAVLVKNDALASRLHAEWTARGLLVLNVLSAPGSGKTTLLERTLERLRDRLRVAVIVGDLATENDANRLRATGAPVVQVNTETVCHLESAMVERAFRTIDSADLKLLVIENVGNLVCPAAFDLGEHLRVVLLSVPEGEDKPLKYPTAFSSAHVVVVSKLDLAGPCGFDRTTALTNVRRLAPEAQVLELSARDGQGMEAWCDFLCERARQLVAVS